MSVSSSLWSVLNITAPMLVSISDFYWTLVDMFSRYFFNWGKLYLCILLRPNFPFLRQEHDDLLGHQLLLLLVLRDFQEIPCTSWLHSWRNLFDFLYLLFLVFLLSFIVLKVIPLIDVFRLKKIDTFSNRHFTLH